MFAPVLTSSYSEEAGLREATELVIVADLAMLEKDYASAAELVEAAYQAFDDAADQDRPVLPNIELPESAKAYVT
jgi:hypothetical protein